MHKVSSKIRKWADEAIKEVGDMPWKEDVERRHLISMAVAIMVGSRLPVPSSALERPREWYIQHCLATAEYFVGQLVEYLVMDVTSTLKLAETIWNVRYRIVHEPASPQARNALIAGIGDSSYEIAPVYRQSMPYILAEKGYGASLMGILLECDGYIKQALPQANEEANADG